MSNGIKGKEQDNKFFTVEFFGVTLIVSSFLLLVCLLFGSSVLFTLGEEIKYSLLGTFGYFAYPLLFSLNIVGFLMLFGKKPSKTFIIKVLRLTLTLTLILLLLTTITNLKTPNSLDEYIANAYLSGRGEAPLVVGGAMFSLVTFYAVSNITYVWSIVLFSALVLLNLIISFLRLKNSISNPPKTTEQPKIEEPKITEQPVNPPVQPIAPQQQPGFNGGYNPYNPQGYQAPQGYQNPQQPSQNYGQGYYGGFSIPQQNGYSQYNSPMSKEEAMRVLYGNNPPTYSQEFNGSMGNSPVNIGGTSTPQNPFNNNGMISNPIPKVEDAPRFTFEDKSSVEVESEYDEYEEDNNTFEEGANKYKPQENASPSFVNDFFKQAVNKPQFEEEKKEPFVVEEVDEIPKYDDVEEIDETPEKDLASKYELFEEYETKETQREEVVKPTPIKLSPAKPSIPESPIFAPTSEEKENNSTKSAQTFTSEYSKHLIENMPAKYKYTPPPISLLKASEKVDNDYQYEIFKAEISNTILETLNNFGVTTQIARVLRGPAISRFDIEVPKSLSMDAITKRYKDINLRIATITPVRMVAPVPGTSYVGIEVANRTKDTVNLRDLVCAKEFLEASKETLTFTLGKDVVGTPLCIDITQMPHLLIAGATKSGKSVCLNTLIVSLLMKYSPEELRLVIIDPKKVEFKFYEKLPHLYFGEIVNNGDIALTTATLNWVYDEMSRRYSVFTESKVKNLESYNKKARLNNEKIMPRILVIIDEFANIMLNDKNGANEKICALAAEARAAGVHLILATQRPSADIMEGPIKANLPARIVFKVASDVDSRVCIGKNGAETLLGSGDGLFKTDGMFDYDRFMGAYVSDEEICDIVDYVKDHNQSYFDYNAWSKIVANTMQSNDVSGGEVVGGNGEVSSSGGEGNMAIDPLNVKAMRIGYKSGGVSTSFLQRKLGVGYPRAAKIIDWLTDNGYITPNAIQGKRQMILSIEEFEEKFGSEGPQFGEVGNGEN